MAEVAPPAEKSADQEGSAVLPPGGSSLPSGMPDVSQLLTDEICYPLMQVKSYQASLHFTYGWGLKKKLFGPYFPTLPK